MNTKEWVLIELRKIIKNGSFVYESRQRTLYSYALQKGYYKPAAPASKEVVQQLRNQLMSDMQN